MPRQTSRLAPIDGFTPRQLELLCLLAEGKTNKEIADHLRIAYGTVKQHLVALFRKLAVTSRHKATIIANQLLRDIERVPTQASALSKAVGYKWRMLSAVAISLPESPAGASAQKPRQIIERKEWLQTLGQFVENHVVALDGQSMVTHNGSILTWFGFPAAHVDDTDRALSLALATRDFAQKHLAEYPLIRNLGIGVANQTELVATDTQLLNGAEVFRQAVDLSEQSQTLGLPLITPLSHRLSHLPLQTGVIKQTKAKPVVELGDALVILNKVQVHSGSETGWGGLPFMENIAQGAENGLAQWVSVSSWPISSTASLMTAIMLHPSLAKFRCVHLRLPARKTRDVLLGRLMSQLNLCMSHPLLRLDSRATAGERLAGQIREICQQGPLCLVVHGQNGLATLRSALTDKGIEMLVGQPLLVIAQAATDGKQEAVVQTLGSRAAGVPFSRSYVLQVPDTDDFVARLKMEVGGVLDALSPLARTILVDGAHDLRDAFDKRLLALSEPVYLVQEALQELQSTGLIVPAQGEGFQFRDPVLAEAICQMDVQLEDAPE